MPPLHLLLGATGVLLAVGVVMVLSASAGGRTVADGMVLTVFVRHLIFLLLGAGAFALGMWVSPAGLRRWTPWLLLACLAALVLVLVPGIGEVRGGARRWISVAGFTVQPGEAAKVVLLLWGAHVLALRGRVVRRGRYAVLPLVPVALLAAALLMPQPALSTTVALGVIVLSLLFFAGAPLLLLGGMSVGALLGVAVLGLTADYRRDRISTFLGAGDELGAGYQSRQALLSSPTAACSAPASDRAARSGTTCPTPRTTSSSPSSARSSGWSAGSPCWRCTCCSPGWGCASPFAPGTRSCGW